MERIDKDLPGAVLYSVATNKQGEELSSRIRRNIEKTKNYFCVHLADGAVVFSNAKFKGAKPRNRRKFLQEVEEIMKRRQIKGMSTRRVNTKQSSHDVRPKEGPWSFADITDKLHREFQMCKTDYEVGIFLKKYNSSDEVLKVHRVGAELLRKIETGEINEDNPNFITYDQGGKPPRTPPLELHT